MWQISALNNSAESFFEDRKFLLSTRERFYSHDVRLLFLVHLLHAERLTIIRMNFQRNCQSGQPNRKFLLAHVVQMNNRIDGQNLSFQTNWYDETLQICIDFIVFIRNRYDAGIIFFAQRKNCSLFLCTISFISRRGHQCKACGFIL